MSDLRNWLERLGDKIPGYTGYAERERRRDVDKLHRERVAERLRGLKGPLNELLREMTDSGRLFETAPVERVVKKLDQIENRVRFASYGYAGFFDAARVESEQLEELYRFDLALVEKVEALEGAVRALGSAGDAKADVTGAERAVDELNRTFDQRHAAIDGFGGGSASGARGSMFGSE